MKSISKKGDFAMEGDRKGPRLEPLLTAKNVADLLHLSRSSIARLVDLEGLPAFVVFRNPRKRILRFREQEVEQWLAGRRERQVTATLNGARYTRHQRSES